MRKFEGHISMSLNGCTVKFEFEVDDDATEEEIEETAREAAFDVIDWSYDETK